MRIMHFPAVLLLLLLVLFSCQRKTEDQFYKDATGIKDSKAKAEALIDFVESYPESDKIKNALFQIFESYVDLKDEQNALLYARAYLEQYPSEGRMRAYNSVSWELAVNNLAVDSAAVWSFKAVQLAQKFSPRSIRNILDTYAYAMYRTGDYSEAEKAQMEAIRGNENNPELLARLALYQKVNNKTDQALLTLCQAIWHNGPAENGDNFKKWIADKYEAAESEEKTFEIIDQFIAEKTGGQPDLKQKSKTGKLFAFCGIRYETAEKYAREGVASLNDQSPLEDIIFFKKNLAHVLFAQKKHSETIDLLTSIQDIIAPYRFDFWQMLGNVYLQNGQKDQALDAYVNGLVVYADEALLNAARATFSMEEIDNHITIKETELKNFQPGQFDVSQITGNRVVLAELFTGSECPPCVAVDQAFDALLEYYPRNKLAILEYHLHIPGPDPMTNKSAEKRYRYYNANFGTPTVYINGGERNTGGGPEVLKKYYFERYSAKINKLLTGKSDVELNLDTNRNSNLINTKININGTLPENEVTLFIALAQDNVVYTGRNGIAEHAYVVRSLQETGIEADSEFEFEFDLTQIEHELKQYLENFVSNPPKRFSGFSGWSQLPVSLDDSELFLIAWIQYNRSREIIQSIHSKIE